VNRKDVDTKKTVQASNLLVMLLC